MELRFSEVLLAWRQAASGCESRFFVVSSGVRSLIPAVGDWVCAKLVDSIRLPGRRATACREAWFHLVLRSSALVVSLSRGCARSGCEAGFYGLVLRSSEVLLARRSAAAGCELVVLGLLRENNRS